MDCPLEYKQKLVEPNHEMISVRRQCRLLGLNRSGLYYKAAEESRENLLLMRQLDEQYTRCPFYGAARMTQQLRKQDYEINEKRVRRLLRKMGLQAICPKPRLSQSDQGAKLYPYLLRGMRVDHSDKVWATDITYIRLWRGFVYLAAIMDWYSRCVLAWEVSVTLDGSFCLSALERALLRVKPEIFNSDQGAQFTSLAFTERLLSSKIRISMDGRGRVFDNIFVERLWRSVKYEEIYLKDYRNVREAVDGLRTYFQFYNRERLHQSLDYQTPEAVYRQGQITAAGNALI